MSNQDQELVDDVFKAMAAAGVSRTAAKNIDFDGDTDLLAAFQNVLSSVAAVLGLEEAEWEEAEREALAKAYDNEGQG